MYLSLYPKQQFKYIPRLLLKYPLLCTTVKPNGWYHTSSVRQTQNTFNLNLSVTALGTQQNNYCTVKTDCAASHDGKVSMAVEEEEDMEDPEEDISSYSVRTAVYEQSDDIFKTLNTCHNHKQLLETIAGLKNTFEYQHHVQSIILLWFFYCHGNSNVKSDIQDSGVLEDTLTVLNSDIHKLHSDESSCCYLYLRKMGVPNANPILSNLLVHALHIIKVSETLVPLNALSRLLVAINRGQNFHTPTVCRDFIPHIEAHIHSCVTAEDARLLAICLYNLQSLIDKDTIDAFKLRVRHLLKVGTLSAETPKAILKLLLMLNLPIWSLQNTHLLRELLLVLQPNISQLEENKIIMIHRIFQHHLEPAGLIEPLLQITEQHLKSNQNLDVLSCLMPFVEPQRRESLIALFKRLLASKESWELPNASRHFFTILRRLKVSDIKICDRYWNSILTELASYPKQEVQMKFLSHCHHYMYFNNNLGGTYRFKPFEKKLSELAMQAIENSVYGRIPETFARLASFVLAYGHTSHFWKKFPNIILSKIITMANQFSITDSFFISRGIQIALEMRFRYHTPSLLQMQLATIDNILTTCAERHLSEKEVLTATELNGIVRSLGHRKSLKNSVVYHEAMKKYSELDKSNLSSRSIRDMAYNFSASNFFVPEALESMFDYIEQNRNYVIGDTVEKVLTCAYNMGYTPRSPEVLNIAATILARDFNHMTGMSLVQACLALCYYKTIPEELIHKVFCVKFIKRIEDEIQLCYSRATYPERVLNLVMQLNRTVCLDFPEANVPWFQQNFVEAQLSKKLFVRSQFNDDVKELLLALLKDSAYFRCNHTTPYGYQIDFVVHFDGNKKPIREPAETTMLDRITKVAILLLKLDSFCENDLTALRGPESLKLKHLEMMGYKVFHINEHDWNSKYMNRPSAKVNYLKNLLQISN